MFSQNPDDCVRKLGENELIERIRAWLGPVAPPAPYGMGDDCAVLPAVTTSRQQIITTDSLTFGQHFDASAHAHDAGAKLMNRNISDIAAMGGTPGPALLNLLFGPDLSLLWLEQFIAGIRQCCEKFGVTVVGGDISQLPPGQFTASVTLTGLTDSPPALRSTAEIGDTIYVTGTLGGSILHKHLHFEPRIKEGQWLAAHEACTAMMDLTDGLGKDLAALLPEGSSAAINLQNLPLSHDARECARKDSHSPQMHAFCDGEDYELLFTVARGTQSEIFEKQWQTRFPELKVSCIGRIVNAHPAGRYIDIESSEALPWQSGFEHFKQT
ncbi:thiamine-phosphate kinase [Coraliomargarita sinensis]|nr:thiamine-phosphate kinase [Coraliomargarita sinensis]